MSKANKKSPKEIILTGLGVSDGIAIGQACIRGSTAIDVPEYFVDSGKVNGEINRLNQAIARVRAEVQTLKKKLENMPRHVAEEMHYLLDAHVQMLDNSSLVRAIVARIQSEKINAEKAVWREITIAVRQFEAIEDSYIAARASDVREVGHKVIQAFGNYNNPSAKIEERGIIIADELTPADTAALDPEKIIGFGTVSGGPESHTAIMARSLVIPAILGLDNVMLKVRNGDQVILDGASGTMVIHPTVETLNGYKRLAKENQDRVKSLTRLRKLEARTVDGTRILVFANIELPRECSSVLSSGAEGIGLLRSEFLFMNRDDLPSEDEQFEALRHVVKAMKGRPVTVRTLDIGGEKLATSLGGYLKEAANPALGLRAVRLSLKFSALLETQLAAILRASAYGPIRIVLPMISFGAQMVQARRILSKVAQRLRDSRVTIPQSLPPMGAMIEIPGAALVSDSLARICDFFAIGTNDLTMYTLAIDRDNEEVAALYDPMHPSLLRLIQCTCQAAWQAGIPCSLCGEIANDPHNTALLLGLGIHELSMAPASVPRVKERILDLDASAARRMAMDAVAQPDSQKILQRLKRFNRDSGWLY